MSSIHAHEIMQMMIDSGEAFTHSSLVKKITDVFGADAIFHSCSEQGMTVALVVNFLEARGKFIPADSGFMTDSSKMCHH